MKDYLMALDQGTTSSRCIIFDKTGNIVNMAQKEFTQIYPEPGWVEHNAMEIWSSQLSVCLEALSVAHLYAEDIAACPVFNRKIIRLICIRSKIQAVCALDDVFLFRPVQV